MPALAAPTAATVPLSVAPRPFVFAADRFAFANELLWEYHFDRAAGKTIFRKREPAPAYAHRCFVLVRAVRQFHYHAHFQEPLPTISDEGYRARILSVLNRNPRKPSPIADRVVFPGFASLHAFSRAHERLLKETCGGAWGSYFLRSHWRMVFPVSRAHQEVTANELLAGVRENRAPIVHLVRFPQLTINHGVIVYDVTETPSGISFDVSDPNSPDRPTTLDFNHATSTFSLPANQYWAGGKVNVLEIFCNWRM